MLWSDIETIITALEENYPDEEVKGIRLIELYDIIISLEEFCDDHERYDSTVLKAIREGWIDLRNDNEDQGH